MKVNRLPQLNRKHAGISPSYPVKLLQVGEGNFIRAFLDWMIHRCNEQGLFQGGIAVTSPRGGGVKKLEALHEQEGLFTLIVRGVDSGQVIDQKEVVASISMAINPYEDWESMYALSEIPEIEYLCSNTTEAGIVYMEQPFDDSYPQQTFPARLTLYLHRRYRSLGSDYGMTIIPCELLERAGDRLREIVLQHAADWRLGEAFMDWVETCNTFANTLVDRIVPGYPDAEDEALSVKLGYHDKLMVTAEPYYEWVIEDQNGLSRRLPLREAGLNVKFVDDLSPYVKRKGRILNGAHTFMTPMAYLLGHDLVRESIEDQRIRDKTERYLREIVLPVLPLSQEEASAYIESTLARFRNPYIDHKLLDIALNCTSKSVTRLRSTLIDYVSSRSKLPEPLFESYAYLFRFYRTTEEDGVQYGTRWKGDRQERYLIQDQADAVCAFAEAWSQYESDGDLLSMVHHILQSERIWGESFASLPLGQEMLAELASGISSHLKRILELEAWQSQSVISD